MVAFSNDGEDAGEPASPVLQTARPRLSRDDECHFDKGSERMPPPGSGLCVIRHISSVERFVKNTFNSFTGRSQQKESRDIHGKLWKLGPVGIRLSLIVGVEDVYVQRQRENARQERSMVEASTASTDHSGLSATSGSASSEVGMFRCTFEGCLAKPFHCPVQGCPRSKHGQGFRRKKEMIRHGFVHESPGYACPFCPDQEHKYPLPDNLQRYVSAFFDCVRPGHWLSRSSS
jgi:hypothetical protein